MYDGLDVNEILRVLNIILVDLKVSGLNLCIFSNANFLSFLNIDMHGFVNLEKLDGSFIEFVQLIYRDFDLDRLNNCNDSILKRGVYCKLDFFM